MRVLVVARPRFQLPPERLPQMVEEALEWRDRHRSELEEFGTFPGGGGFGICDVPDTESLNRLILEMPFSPFSEHDVYPFVPGDTGLQQLRDRVAEMAGSR
jgi:hypothetical protein